MKVKEFVLILISFIVLFQFIDLADQSIASKESIKYKCYLEFGSEHFWDFEVKPDLIYVEWLCDSKGLGPDSQPFVIKAKKTKRKGWLFQPTMLKKTKGKVMARFYGNKIPTPIQLPYTLEKDIKAGKLKTIFSVDEFTDRPAVIYLKIFLNDRCLLNEKWEGNMNIWLYGIQFISLTDSDYPEIVIVYQDYRYTQAKIFSAQPDKALLALADVLKKFSDKVEKYYKEGQNECWTECDTLKYLLEIWDRIKEDKN